jgi:thiol:disulfide interchange protein
VSGDNEPSMSRCIVLACVAVVIAGAASLALAAPEPTAPKVSVELLSEVRAIASGETFWVALRQRIAPGWHTYWMNPGDSGEPPRVEWALPTGFTAGEIAWPYPERIPVGPAMSFGYSDEVVLPIPLTAPTTLKIGSRVALRAQASWVVCEKTCIPEEAPVALTLPVVGSPAAPDPRGAPLIAAARRAVPTPSPWTASFVATPAVVTLRIDARGLSAERITEIAFFPSRWGAIENAAPQRARADAAGISLEMTRGPLAEAAAAPIEGVLVVAERLDGGTARHALSLTAAPRTAPSLDERAAVSLVGAMALALGGGLLLNLMPCVLPVLSVKALGLLQHASGRPAVLRLHGLAYTGGVLASFAVVVAVLIALRAGGEQLGWGFQLQSPVFVTFLAGVLFAVALTLSGIVVVGTQLAAAGQSFAARSGYGGSFATGALATVAATPCTAPLMGAAVGFALTQPWATALIVFETLGLGLALPYLVLTFVPGWRRLLPRPGPWMVRLQQLLAFPLYASVAWLVWVVSQQSGPSGVAVALAALVLIALAAWLHYALSRVRALWRRTATLAILGLAVGAVGFGPWLGTGSPSTRTEAVPSGGVAWEPFSPSRLAELRAAGKPVFVNFTAAWCITCLVNERVALRSATVIDVFARKGVVPLKADWTTRDPAITQVLASLGRSGVPLYVLYPAGTAGEARTGPLMLPQILSEQHVIDAIEKKI